MNRLPRRLFAQHRVVARTTNHGWTLPTKRLLATTKASSSNKAVRSGGVNVGDVCILACIPLVMGVVLGEAYFRTELGDAEVPDDCAYPPTDQLLQSHHVRTLERDGLVVIPNALDPAALQAVREELFRLQGGGDDGSNSNNKTAEIKMKRSTNDEDVRQDRVAWVKDSVSHPGANKLSKDTTDDNCNDDDPVEEHMKHCIRTIRGVMHALTKHSFSADNNDNNNNDNDTSHSSEGQQTTTITSSTTMYQIPRKCQLAMYPGDGSALYRRHLDQCHNSFLDLGLLEWLRLSDYRARSISVILYLNQADRPESDGGALRCWVKKENNENRLQGDSDQNDDDKDEAQFYPPFDIQPKGGTMVIFKSDKVEHMVLSSSADRYAITSWVSRVPGT